MDDRQLLVKTRDGNEPAARLLWDRYAPRLIHYARAILPARLAPEDAVQAVFCRVVALDRSTVRQVDDVAAWLTSLVRREALNTLRTARRERGRLERLASIAARTHTGRTLRPGPDDAEDRLSAALESLPRRLREVVTLKHVSGLTFDQIALALTVNRSTAATRYRAAIEALRIQLGGAAPGSDVPPAPAEVLHG